MLNFNYQKKKEDNDEGKYFKSSFETMSIVWLD